MPSWLGQERGWPVTALTGSRPRPGWGPQLSGSRCSTSIRLVMKKLFCRAATPRSGRMEVWRQTGQERVRLWGGI